MNRPAALPTVLVVRSRLALRLVLPLAAVVAAAVIVVLLVSGGSSGRVDTAQAQPIVDPQGTPAKVPAKPYVVLIVMDEFPGDALLDAQRSDRPDPLPEHRRAGGQRHLVPQRLVEVRLDDQGGAADPRRPAPATRDRPPTYADHPHSFFELLGRRGYRIVRPRRRPSRCARPRWCPGASARTPAIIPNLQGGRPERFERFVRSIRPGRPTFWFKHALLPHKPYLYLPSGHTTRTVGRSDPMPGMDTVPGFYDEFLTRHNEQRFLLQLGYTDRLLGQLFARLKSQGMFDKTLVAITADHGLAWQVGVPTRRSVDDRNVEEIAPVPLIVKAPGQRQGRVDDALVSTLDVTPTLADVLGWRLALPRRRQPGEQPRRAAAPHAAAAEPRVHADDRDLGPALEGAPCGGGPAAAAPARQRGAEPVHRHRPEPRADREAGRRRAGRGGEQRAGGRSRTARPTAPCDARAGSSRRRSPATCGAGGAAPSAISRWRSTARIVVVGRSFHLEATGRALRAQRSRGRAAGRRATRSSSTRSSAATAYACSRDV